MTKFTAFGKRLIKNEDGATAIEYGLLAALISVVIIAAVGTLGGNLKSTFESVNSQMVTQKTPGAKK